MFVLPLDRNELEDLLGRIHFSVTSPRRCPTPGQGNRLALVVSETTDSGRRRNRFGDVVALAVAKADGLPSTLDRRVRVEHLTMLDRSFSVSSVRGSVSDHHYGALRQAVLAGRGTGLTRSASLALAEMLRRRVGDRLVGYLESVSGRGYVVGRSVARWQQEADAIRVVLRAAGIDSRELDAWRPPAPSEPYLAGLQATPSEASLIDHDSRRLPGWEVIETARPDIRVFSRAGRMIEVLSANATGMESLTGVDLVYYHHQAQSLVFVQYKKLKNGSVAIDKRLESQLKRMRAVSSLGTRPTAPDNYRLGTRTSCFIKLTSTDRFDPSADRLMRGMYLPIDYVDLLLGDLATFGPRGGQQITERTVRRFINNTLFVKLLGEAWIGTNGVSLADVLQLGADTILARRSLVLAVDAGDAIDK